MMCSRLVAGRGLVANKANRNIQVMNFAVWYGDMFSRYVSVY
jgi:hypothetical protein